MHSSQPWSAQAQAIDITMQETLILPRSVLARITHESMKCLVSSQKRIVFFWGYTQLALNFPQRLWLSDDDELMHVNGFEKLILSFSSCNGVLSESRARTYVQPTYFLLDRVAE